MPDQQIQVTPAQLREIADDLEKRARSIGQSVEKTSQIVETAIVRSFLAGHLATQLYTRYRQVHPTMETWPGYLIQFAQQLRQAADVFEEADTSPAEASASGPQWRTHYDNEDAWRRIIENDEQFLDEIEGQLSGWNYWMNKLAGVDDDYERIRQETEQRIMQSRERLAMDLIDNIDGLKPEVWQTLTPEQRLEVLEEVHRAYASAYGADPISVSMDTTMVDTTRGAVTRHGSRYNLQGDLTGYSSMTLAINDDLLNSSDPTQALTTMVHESRHVVQLRAVLDGSRSGAFDYVPDSVLDDWRRSFNQYDRAKMTYWERPSEVDARGAGSRASDHLYE